MTDETLHAMLAFFPIMMLVAAVEARAIRSADGLIYGLMTRGVPFVGLVSSVLGCAFTLLALGARAHEKAGFNIDGGIWTCAGFALGAAALVSMILFVDGWLRPSSSESHSTESTAAPGE